MKLLARSFPLKLPLQRNPKWPIRFVVLPILALLASSGCNKPAPTIEPTRGGVFVQVDPELTWATIVAKEASRAAVLAELHEQYGIEVRPYEVADEPITVRVERKPLIVAIEALFPAGAHYVLRIGDRELEFGANKTREKKGDPLHNDPKLPTKGRTEPLAPGDRDDVKIEPEKWRPPVPQENAGLKPPAKNAVDVPRGEGATRDRKDPPEERSGRLRFQITATNQVRLLHAEMVDGGTVVSPVVRGTLLYAFRRANGALVLYGSLPDPLEVHSYNTDGTHSGERAKEGTFGIWVPPSLLSDGGLGGLTLHLYDAGEVVLPSAFDDRSFEAATKRATILAQIPGDELLTALGGD